MNPLLVRLALVLALVALAFGSGATLGYRYARNAGEAQKAVAQTVAIEAHAEASVIGQAVERETVQRHVKTEAVFNGITQGAIIYAQSHPAATDCRLDADGLRLWESANANTDPAAAGERDADVPGTPTATERRDDGSARQSHPGDAGLSPVPESAPRLGQLAGANPHYKYNGWYRQ